MSFDELIQGLSVPTSNTWAMARIRGTTKKEVRWSACGYFGHDSFVERGECSGELVARRCPIHISTLDQASMRNMTTFTVSDHPRGVNTWKHQR